MCLQGGLPGISLATYVAGIVTRKGLGSAALDSGVEARIARQRGSRIPDGGRLQVWWRRVHRSQIGTVLGIR